MSVIANRTGTTMRFEAYDANKQFMDQSDPAIPNGFARYVNQGHVGSADYFYILAFYDSDEFEAPPGIGIIQGTEGAGISIAGAGGFSVTVTVAYSQPVAAVRLGLHDEWTLNPPASIDKNPVFTQGGDATNASLMGW